MIRDILIVDDDQEMLLSLKEGLERYGDTFSVLLAGDGEDAIKKLKNNHISLVVTDLKMPRIDGFALLAHVMENYPDIPVIMITAYSTPKMKIMAKEGGAVGYIEKPFLVEDLARKIMSTLRNEADGGTLHSVSSGMFLQVIEMEQKTCTIRVDNSSLGKKGVLFFREGNLLDARINGIQGESAALQILSWDNVNISIQNECLQQKKIIHGDLQAILLEAMRLKDEAQRRKELRLREEARRKEEAGKREEARKKEEIASRIEEHRKSETAEILQKPEESVFHSIKTRLESELGERSGIQEIYGDNSWDKLISEVSEAGSIFDAGKLKTCYLDREEPNDLIIIPGIEGEKTIAIKLKPNSAIERIMKVLNS
ncbi:MAG: response regulator [Deltaproteobacteria bacterium]|nr:response regulator [Deltaproteobacteria bacterium]